MSRSFVIDASVGFAWVHPHQATTETDKLLDSLGRGTLVIVPSLWSLEVANALLVAVRRKKMTAQERTSALEYLRCLNITIDSEGSALAFSTLSALAETYDLSIYDACYLELALRRRVPLGSRDAPLCAAAKQCGIRLV